MLNWLFVSFSDISFSDDDEDLDDPVSLTGLDHPGGPLTATPPHQTPASSSYTSSLTPTSPSKYETNNNHQSSLLDKDDKVIPPRLKLNMTGFFLNYVTQ